MYLWLRIGFSSPVIFGAQSKCPLFRYSHAEHMLHAFLLLWVEFKDEFFKEREYNTGYPDL